MAKILYEIINNCWECPYYEKKNKQIEYMNCYYDRCYCKKYNIEITQYIKKLTIINPFPLICKLKNYKEEL